MNMKKIRNILLTVVIAGTTLLFNQQAAAVPGPWIHPNVTLMATLNNSPALSPVRWSVYRMDNGSTVPYGTYDKRHSLAISLPPGRYVAEASLSAGGTPPRSRMFDVGNRTTNNIVVALD